LRVAVFSSSDGDDGRMSGSICNFTRSGGHGE
jgi:hypothetical protein